MLSAILDTFDPNNAHVALFFAAVHHGDKTALVWHAISKSAQRKVNRQILEKLTCTRKK